jgi:phosphoglycolate phosphatase
VLIVRNNAEGPIRRFLEQHQLDHLVQASIGRVPGHPELMKPHPDSIQRALHQLHVPSSDCAFIGDSVSDITVSHITGVHSIGYAKNARRGDELAAAAADALVVDLVQLAAAIQVRGEVRALD